MRTLLAIAGLAIIAGIGIEFANRRGLMNLTKMRLDLSRLDLRTELPAVLYGGSR